MIILLKNGSLKGEKNVDILIENDKIIKNYWPLGVPFWNLNLGVVYQIYVLKESH